MQEKEFRDRFGWIQTKYWQKYLKINFALKKRNDFD